MVFHSILFNTAGDRARADTAEPPDFFDDLFLDQVVDAITAGKQAYNLKPFFYTPLTSIDAVAYRHEVMRDLEDGELFENIKAFAEKMRAVHRLITLIGNLYYRYNQEGWFLEAVETYSDAVESLARDLSEADLHSRGLRAFREYFTDYARSEQFTSRRAQARALKDKLSAVRYCFNIRGQRVTVRKYEGQSDYSAEVEQTFERFKQGAVKDYRVSFSTDPGMNHVEEQILGLVAKLYPDIFAELDGYYAAHRLFLDETVRAFDREIQFYVAYLEYMAMFKRTGLTFCYPEIAMDKELHSRDGFDLALAYKLMRKGSRVIVNDFALQGNERVIVVSGPNQGGKTTFARTFGQLHYLTSLGCLVPGREARLFLPDRIFTHFEKEESILNLRGKLQDDLVRIHRILSEATSNSVIIMNELFTSTTLRDGIVLSRRIMERVLRLDALCVYVTFIVEVASFSDKIVSMVSTVNPDDPAERTYKILRRPADGLAYAISVAKKHGLTYHSIKERIGS